MLIVFFDISGVVHHEYIPKGQTVDQQVYKEVLIHFWDATRRKRPELWSSGDYYLHHDNAPAHTVLKVHNQLTKNKVSVLPHPQYSPDLIMWLKFDRVDIFSIFCINKSVLELFGSDSVYMRHVWRNSRDKQWVVCSRKAFFEHLDATGPVAPHTDARIGRCWLLVMISTHQTCFYFFYCGVSQVRKSSGFSPYYTSPYSCEIVASGVLLPSCLLLQCVSGA